MNSQSQAAEYSVFASDGGRGRRGLSCDIYWPWGVEPRILPAISCLIRGAQAIERHGIACRDVSGALFQQQAPGASWCPYPPCKACRSHRPSSCARPACALALDRTPAVCRSSHARSEARCCSKQRSALRPRPRLLQSRAQGCRFSLRLALARWSGSQARRADGPGHTRHALRFPARQQECCALRLPLGAPPAGRRRAAPRQRQPLAHGHIIPPRPPLRMRPRSRILASPLRRGPGAWPGRALTNPRIGVNWEKKVGSNFAVSHPHATASESAATTRW